MSFRKYEFVPMSAMAKNTENSKKNCLGVKIFPKEENSSAKQKCFGQKLFHPTKAYLKITDVFCRRKFLVECLKDFFQTVRNSLGFRFSSLNWRNGLPILGSPLTGFGASRKKHLDL